MMHRRSDDYLLGDVNQYVKHELDIESTRKGKSSVLNIIIYTLAVIGLLSLINFCYSEIVLEYIMDKEITLTIPSKLIDDADKTEDGIARIKEDRNCKDVYIDSSDNITMVMDVKAYEEYKNYTLNTLNDSIEELLDEDDEFSNIISDIKVNSDYTEASIYVESYGDLISELAIRTSAVYISIMLQRYECILDKQYDTKINVYDVDNKLIEIFSENEIDNIIQGLKELDNSNNDNIELTISNKNNVDAEMIINNEGIIYDKNNIKIWFKGIQSSGTQIEPLFYVENDSDKNIIIESNDYINSSVNGYKTYMSVWISIDSGLKCTETGTISSEDLEVNGIETINNVYMPLKIIEQDSYDEIDTFELIINN